MNKNKPSFKKTIHKISTVILVITLVLGIAASGFGISVAALTQKEASKKPSDNSQATQEVTQPEETYKSPTDDYSDFSNEVTVTDNVKMLSPEESAEINNALIYINNQDVYGEQNLVLTLNGENLKALENVYSGDIIYLDGDQNSAFGEGRFFKIEDNYSSDGKTYLYTTEPALDEVFETMEYAASDILTEENFVEANCANGVSFDFGEFDETSLNLTQTENISDVETKNTKKSNEKPQVTQLANDYSSPGDDLIISLNVDILSPEGGIINLLTDPKNLEKDNKNDKNKKEDDNKNNKGPVDYSLKLEGQFGIKDLTTHLVCDKDGVLSFEELYLGISGQLFADVHLTGDVSLESTPKETGKEWKYLELKGLNEKRFPIAVFKFQGTTPIYITNSAFDAANESVIPSIYIILYADWEGKISIELSAGFTYGHSFNSGLRVFKEGEPCMQFEEYPYTSSYDAEDEDGLIWDIGLKFEAETDFTLFGTSAVFYIAGINVGEFALAKIGAEAKASAEIKADSVNGLTVEKDDFEFYIRGYLKLIGIKVKLSADGRKLLDFISVDVDIDFTLIDITLFEKGHKPDKYKPVKPVSSFAPPTEFASVMSVVFDVSGSMDWTIDTGERKIDAAKSASKFILSTAKSWSENSDDKFGIGVIKFSDNSEVISVPHTDYPYIEACIDSIDGSGGTDIYSGVEGAVSQLSAVEAKDKTIILLTDGQDGSGYSAEEIADLAKRKSIKVFTIGFGDDVDQEFLKTIASVTGGEYKFANTTDIMGIISSFIYAQQASTSEVLSEYEGTVQEGKTVTANKFSIDDKTGDLVVTNAWPGSFLDTILIDPTGREVDEEYPGAVIDETKIPTTVTVKNPIKGDWTVKIKGVETSYENEPFYTIVSFKASEEKVKNEPMTDMQTVASYCIPIGLLMTIASTLLLVCFAQKKDKSAKKEKKTKKGKTTN